ncbi:MAG: methyltransferase domain-containing protein [Treponema sp.]|nr:methyltransferase domain-containing protein [Treponema sp.]
MNPAVSPGGPVLLVPCVEPGKGGGHLTRCVTLLRELRRLGRNAFLYLETGGLSAFHTLIKGSHDGEAWGSCLAWLISGREKAAEMPWEVIVLDRFQTPPEEYAFWASLGPLLGIDEGGPLRDDFSFLLDLLPCLPGLSPPNLMDPSLLPLPLKKRPNPAPDVPSGKLKVLVSFGAEDKAGLGPLAAGALEPLGKEIELTLLDPPAGKFIPELREHLADYDLLITHFGITAFEAVYAGLAVLLISPEDYHERLAHAAGFFSAGVGLSGLSSFTHFIIYHGALDRNFVEGLRKRSADIAKRYGLDKVPRLSLAAFIEKLRPRGNFQRDRPCPACGAARNLGETPDWDGIPGGNPMDSVHQVLARFPDRTYRWCPRCGIVYMNRLTEPPIEYTKEYFFEFYKEQYGKTYIEDFPNLIALGKRRLKLISLILVRKPGELNPRLLDVGCAYGPFLKAASQAGFDPVGVEASGEAAAYVTRELKLPVIQGFFPFEAPPADSEGFFHSTFTLPVELQSEGFSVLSLWYVIEHFQEPRLALKEAKRLLRPGGVLAFATPSLGGVSGRKSSLTFLENSPADHWTVWSPKICGPLLKRSGFSLKKIVVTGHHPERFPLGRVLFKKRKGPLYGFFLLVSRLFRLGDSFEVYAVKDKD